MPPILRPEVLAAPSTRWEHLLVYQTAQGNAGLARTLAGTGMECRIYGMRRGISEEQVEGNLRYRPFDEAGFISDLASARAVICGGGFTVLGEAVYLRKPTLSVPVRGQFQQVLNARWLERLGYGCYAESLRIPPLSTASSTPSPAARRSWPAIGRMATNGCMRPWKRCWPANRGTL
ncbi:MAG TPA: glycosyltransferase family protein [Thermoanaerobaculia bacterium]|nr:glycosyltransferase family protein [Thermoanaerobaculia bacterium]